MPDAPITFLCPACGIQLTVPASLAGVSGPCPSCSSQIQAPLPVRADIPEAPELPRPEGYERITSPVPVSPTPVYQAPQVESPEVRTSPALVRPEPRQLPSRSNPAGPVAKQMPEPRRGDSTAGTHHSGARPSRRNSRLVRVLVPLMFIAAALAIGAGVVTLLKKQGNDRRDGAEKRVPATLPILPVAPIPSGSADVRQLDLQIPSLPVPSPAQPDIIQPAPSLPEGSEPKRPSDSAMEVLNRFLTAETLAERLPLIECHTPEAELAKTCLAGPLPETRDISLDVVENNPVEQVADFYHILNFDAGNGRKNPQTLLVRIRGTAEPKVVVDPFLDTFGGRLATYAKSPGDKGGTFQVIVWPLASCYDEHVPARDKKLTLKLLPQDNAKEIALAYFSKQSDIAEMLVDGNYSLKYGSAKACTVMLRWNTEEDPQTPYLEAIALKSLDWNP